MTFIKEEISYRSINISEHECVVTEIFSHENKGKIKIINYYNPCKALSYNLLNRICSRGRHKEIWCGDFNAYNSLWGSKFTDPNAEVVEEMMNDRMLVCLNNGTGMSINIYNNTTSCIDLTLVDKKIASKCEWKVEQNINMGSDNFPIFCKIETEISKQQNCIHHKWCFQKANWEKFQKCCNEMNSLHVMDEPIDKLNDSSSTLIQNLARQSIPVINS